ncbi:hypothetical protein SLA2020_355290 [Shorea laevis]
MAPPTTQAPPPRLNGLALHRRDPQALHRKPKFLLRKPAETVWGYIQDPHIGMPVCDDFEPGSGEDCSSESSSSFQADLSTKQRKMIGPEAIFFHQGAYHSRLKKLVQASFLPSAIKGSVSEIENIVLKLLPTWKNCTINTLQEMKRYAFDVAMISALGNKQDLEMEGIKSLYQCLEKGYNSMPLDLPGTPFRKAMKARKLLNETLRRLIEKRRESGRHGGGLQSHRSHFAAHDTTASVLTWILKYLHDNANLLDAVTREQEGIQRKLFEANRGLTWEDTRRMPLTGRVIQETLRSASILSFTFREAVQDVEFEGYFIPKGWKVLPLFRTIHHSAEFFPQPEKFDPSRFEVPPRPNTYMPFGNGVHACPGSELAKLEILILLHHLTTSCRWQSVGGEDGIQYGPFPVPKRGLPIKVTVRKKKEP